MTIAAVQRNAFRTMRFFAVFGFIRRPVVRLPILRWLAPACQDRRSIVSDHGWLRYAGTASGLFRCLLHRGRVVEQNPFDHRDRQTAVLDTDIVELAEPEIVAVSILVAAEQIHNLPFAGDVADFLSRAVSCARCFAFGCFAIQSSSIHTIFYALFDTPPARVPMYVRS